MQLNRLSGALHEYQINRPAHEDMAGRASCRLGNQDLGSIGLIHALQSRGKVHHAANRCIGHAIR